MTHLYDDHRNLPATMGRAANGASEVSSVACSRHFERQTFRVEKNSVTVAEVTTAAKKAVADAGNTRTAVNASQAGCRPRPAAESGKLAMAGKVNHLVTYSACRSRRCTTGPGWTALVMHRRGATVPFQPPGNRVWHGIWSNSLTLVRYSDRRPERMRPDGRVPRAVGAAGTGAPIGLGARLSQQRLHACVNRKIGRNLDD